MLSRSIVTLLCAVTLAPGLVLAQEQPTEPTPEQTISRLQSQWEALFVASMVAAQGQGQSPAEHGASIGQLFAPGWSDDLTPQGLARGMRNNFRLIGGEAELTRDTEDVAVVRWRRLDQELFMGRHGSMGAIVDQYEECLKAVVEGIADAHNLVWAQETSGDWMVARVTRKG